MLETGRRLPDLTSSGTEAFPSRDRLRAHPPADAQVKVDQDHVWSEQINILADLTGLIDRVHHLRQSCREDERDELLEHRREFSITYANSFEKA